MRKNFTLILIPVVLLCFGLKSGAQTLDLSKSVSNITTSGNGVSASQNDILEYTILVKSLTGAAVTNARLYDNIPAGAVYVAGSTSLNGSTVADVDGKMPYTNTGDLINSPSALPGVLTTNNTATIKFRVRITANGGNVKNFATVEFTSQGVSSALSTNTVFTNLTPDPACSIVYQSTASTQNGFPQSPSNKPYRYIRQLNTTNGTAGSLVYNGEMGKCRDAISNAVLPDGSVMTYTSAIAYDKNSNRVYFVNNSSSSIQDLSYVDFNTFPVTAKRFTGYPLETSTGSGWNINRMAFASDGYGYAITESGSDIIRFYINSSGLPVITRMGPLQNDVTNGSNDILDERGGDIFGDGSGNLYLIANSSNLYKIDPNSRISTFLGSVNPFPGTSNSIAVDAAGNVYIGGAYQNVYTVNLATMNASSITGGSMTNVWTNGDYTSCAFPVLSPDLAATKTYSNINGRPWVIGGDTVEYRIEVTNSGNINAAGVKLYDGIPAATEYIPGSAKLNGVTVPDLPGSIMPFSVAGGRLINSSTEQPGIIKPGDANKAVVTFRAKVSPANLVCNQSRITLIDASGNTIFINSNDPSQPSHQDPTCFYSDGVLPLGNISLKGSINNTNSVLQWKINSELNIAQFDIEYSEDGVNFRYAGSVRSKGNTSAVNAYQFTDLVNTSSEIRFYRLKIVNTKGDHSYTPVIKLSSKNLQLISVQPNPFEREINIRIQLKNAENLELMLMDLQGRKVLSKKVAAEKGSQTIIMNAPASLAPGMYIFELRGSSEIKYQQKLLKSKF
jgi:uncharacterized repeat protein (TIGR01451 family)